MNNSNRLFCVKMRASLGGAHISGAERIVSAGEVPETAEALAARALAHPKGTPDDIRVRVEIVEEPLHVNALPVATETTSTAADGMRRAAELLAECGVTRAAEIVTMFRELPTMRGAALVDADTLERLEPDRERGVRATRMDAARAMDANCGASAASAGPRVSTAPGKNHFSEAIVLASKVQAAPGIVAEICVSDDPDYVTGYVAAGKIGYRRITTMKKPGDPRGGRIFLFRGPRSLVPECIRFLQERAVLVDGVPTAPASAEKSVAPEPTPQSQAQISVSFSDSLNSELDSIRDAGLFRSCRECDGATGPRALVNGRDTLILASNDYCDLAGDPRVTDAAASAARRWGAGTGGSRLLSGSQPPHTALERHIAAFKGTDDAVLFGSGYMANVGTIQALCGRGDVVLSDELNHASIIDGCRLSRADVRVYRHGDMEDLARALDRVRGARRTLVVSDSVFSMDGDLLDLPRFVALCRERGAVSMIDEAHATGVVGASGRGLCEHFGCAAPDVIAGTLSKALGASGGFAAGSRALAELLRNKARSFIFSTSLPASVVAAADAALSALEAEPWRAAAVRENATFLVKRLVALGIPASTQSAIVPIPVGDERVAVRASEILLNSGFWIPAIRYPTVARGTARLRASVMATHTREDLSAAALAVADALRRARATTT